MSGAIQTKGRRTMLAKFLGWIWIIGLIAAAAVIITRLHEWETVLIVLGIIAGINVCFAVTWLAITAICADHD
jgi:hypothetical protein